MNIRGGVCRQFLRRHAEAFFIIAFLLADFFASEQVLVSGTVAAILYVALPAIRAMPKLDPKGRIAFLKAFVKTPNVHRLGILLFWLYSIRFLMYAAVQSHLFVFQSHSNHPYSLLRMFVTAVEQFSLIWIVIAPFATYLSACAISIFLRNRLKGTHQDPDLVIQRQTWSGVSYFLFLAAFLSAVMMIMLNKIGPAHLISNWLIESAIDSNLFVPPIGTFSQGVFPPGAQTATVETYFPLYMNFVNKTTDPQSMITWFDGFVISSCSAAAILLLIQPALRFNTLMLSFCWRVKHLSSLQNLIECFLEALRMPLRQLNFLESNLFLKNTFRSLCWLITCYGFLFWLFGFCGGSIGEAIQSWMIGSAVSAGFGNSFTIPTWLLTEKFRIFIASMVALYCTAPFAVMSAAFLPLTKPRKIVINSDGLLFAQGPYLSLCGRQFRLWSDLKSVAAKTLPARSGIRAEITLAFASGGHVSFSESQLSPKELRILLNGIDQHASSCLVEDEVYKICKGLEDADKSQGTSDGIPDTAVVPVPLQEFKSTVFMPFSVGDFLPGTQTRIIRMLSTKPHCAVYLARQDDGRMVTVKQFYMPDETEETTALKKMLVREYELLSNLDHPGIAKVHNAFTFNQSTFLIIEHRLGTDLRKIVSEHGPRSEVVTISWAKQLSEILRHLHGREPSILHRDISPDNIIAGDDGQLRLIDFGASREFLDGITGTMIGKHSYVAPEQLRGEASQRSDIYSFGCTLYFLLTGNEPVPLSQSSPAQVMDCSQELDQLIRDCTEFEEERRPHSVEEIITRLNDMDKGFKLKFAVRKEAKEVASL